MRITRRRQRDGHIHDHKDFFFLFQQQRLNRLQMNEVDEKKYLDGQANKQQLEELSDFRV
jgi:hypothetical protein